MVVELILVSVSLMLLGSGLVLGYRTGKEIGQRSGYQRGFSAGVDFARKRRRRERGRPLYDHLRLVRDERNG